MKKTKFTFNIWVFVFCLITVSSSKQIIAQQNINNLSLEDVIFLAQERSPEALIAKHRFRSKYWQFRSFRAQYLPAISLDATLPNLNRSIEGITLPDGTDIYTERQISRYSAEMSISQKVGITGGSLFIRSGLSRMDNFGDSTITSFLSTPVNIGFTQPLFQYNSYKWDKKIEPLKYEEAERKYLEDIEDISIKATSRFFNLLMAQINREIEKKNYSNYDTLYRVAQGRYNLGKIAENELLQLELSLLNARAGVENIELEYENNLFQLKSFLRIKDEEVINLLPPQETFHFPIDIEKAIDEAKNNTSTGIAFERRLIEAESSVDQARKNGRFDADIYAVYGLTQSASTFDEAYKEPSAQQQLRIGIQVPIVDWGVSKGKIKMAESMEELQKTSIQQEKIDFEQNIYLKIMQFSMQENQLKIAAKSDTIAQKRFDITQKRYMIGKVNDILELSNAQIDNDRSKISYYSSLRNYWQNYFEIRKLTLYDFKENKRLDFDIDLIQ